jgi:hypothetical protein
MPKSFTEQVFRTTYKDDFRDSDNYHRVLFNSGRALQARELTQLQTIIQKEISRMGSNIFNDGGMVQSPSIKLGNPEFVKISGNPAVFDDVTKLVDVNFTGESSNLKVKVLEAIAAEGDDPDTLFIQYMDLPAGSDEKKRLIAGEELVGTVDGNVETITVQSVNTIANPAVGVGTKFHVGDGSFFSQGHFVFSPKQSITVSKYNEYPTETVGFKVIQDIVTVSDNEALYDNQGVTPNRSSPGADRYRIRLILTLEKNIESNENFVYLADIQEGVVRDVQKSSESYYDINKSIATRIDEINGDFIKKYFKTRFEPNDDDTFKLIVDPGTAYIRGYRIDKEKSSTLVVPKSKSTTDIVGEQISVDYGNYYEFGSGSGMLDFTTCEKVNLTSSTNGNGAVIATANVRAIKEGSGSNFNLYLFNIRNVANSSYSLRQTKSVVSSTNSSNYVNLVLTGGNSVLKEPKKDHLILDTPLPRPKSFDTINITVAEKKNFTATGTTQTIDIFTADENKSLVNEGDIIVSSATEFNASGVTFDIASDNQITFTGLTNGVSYQVLYYVQLSNQSIRKKTLVETTITATLDSDGYGLPYINLGKSDIYSTLNITKDDSDGDSLNGYFYLDDGRAESHYDDGKLIYKGSGLDSDNQPVFVRFNHFQHGDGAFYGVNTYNGQVDYINIPVQKLTNGTQAHLRDAIDFRPATDGNGNFTNVVPLPQPTDAISCNATYYMPRNDKLVLSKQGEMRYLTGTASLTPKFPSTPVDCIDLYKYQLNANTLHTKDLKSSLIPKKGYTMEDINKLEKRLDKVEELTTLSLLELATNSLKVLDSAGVDRTKSGFFVDNFSNQRYTDTKNPEHRASLDPRKKLIRPTFKEDAIELYFDSAHSNTIRTTRKGDTIMLDYVEELHTRQNLASKTENLNPFFVERILGTMTISPQTDYWKESEIAAPRIIDGGTELDTRQALLWNNWEWNWGGVDINDLEVGATSSNVTGVSTTVVQNQLEPRLIGTNVTEEVGDWVVSGTTSWVDVENVDAFISSSTEEVWQSTRTRETDWSSFWGGDTVTRTRLRDTVETVTTEARTNITATNTTNLEQTTTISTENEYANTTEIVTNTDTTTTVNRIASESTVREVIGTRVIDVAVIPWMRSRRVHFKAEGLRPNSQYFAFFDAVNVSRFCREENTFTRVSERNESTGSSAEDNVAGINTPTNEHSQGSTDLITDANGTIIGSFEIPNNSMSRFRTGTREFTLLDISVFNETDALSKCSTLYTSEGVTETFQDDIKSTRVLEVVGTDTTVRSVDYDYETTNSTETIVTTSVATDVETETTVTTLIGDRTTTSQVIDTNRVIESQWQEWSDPLAQTVACPDPNGMFITKVRVYFSDVDDENIPAWVEIRPVINGRPDSHKILGKKLLQSSEITRVPTENRTIDSMVNNGTDFVFDEPVFVGGSREYAIVLRSNSMKYKVFISETEDFVLGSTEKRISKQPTLGSLFKSQNSTLWEPSQTQDLAFEVYAAKFETSGNAILHNAIVPWTRTTRHPLVLTSGSSEVEIIRRGHGLRIDDKIKLELSEDYWNDLSVGITYSDLADEHVVIAVDGASFKIDVGTSATKSGRFGGGQVRFTPNYVFDTLRVNLDIAQPETTNVTVSGKFVTGQSLAGSETAYIKDTSYSIVQNKKNVEFNTPRVICNETNRQSFLSAGEYPVDLQVSMTTTDQRVSPVIDMQRAGLVTIANLIDNQDSASNDGFNVPINYIPETDPFGGTHLAKHITIPTTLEEEAVGLRIMVAANKPPSADFDVYYRVADAGSNLSTSEWVLVESENTLPSDTNKNIFREYRYLVGGIGGNLDPFTKFQIKIVMRSTNSAKVPVFRDLRAIALAV